jgi:tRNA threonylcarbamoyladenosine biosynthesis protein TsaE
VSQAADVRVIIEPPGESLDEKELTEWGRMLGASLHPPRVVALSGDLGAGKTRLAQAICQGYGVTRQVTSPTFALIHRYESPRSPVYHVDLYRLTGIGESAALGLEELFSENALAIVEWPERGETLLPEDAIRIALEMVPGHPLHRRVRRIR